MPDWSSRAEPELAAAGRAFVAALVLVASLSVSTSARADFTVERAETRLRDGVYLLSARFGVKLPEAPREALASGVPLHFAIEMRVERTRNWWVDKTIAELTQRYRLEYHALSERYLVINLNTGEQLSYVRLGQALETIAMLDDFPLLDRVLVGEGVRYQGFVRIVLEIGELPFLMVPGAYLSGDWRQGSEDYEWLLK